ncbi:MAG: TMEM43 family protein [Magnetococcales bacterium]|nr:TMEM43 family protein [Magnetococcales bacterium]
MNDDRSPADNSQESSGTRFTETSTRSWGSNIASSFSGMLVGLVLILVGLGLMWWNEGRTVERYNTLQEGLGAVVEAPMDRIDPAQENRLIHLTGETRVNGELADSVFGVTSHAVRMRREVAMFQWVEKKHEETRKQTGGSSETVTTYEYVKEWSGQLQKSGQFRHPVGHDNPADLLYASQEYTATDVRLGRRVLSAALIEQISDFKRLELTPGMMSAKRLPRNAQLHDGGIYLGRDPGQPAIGEMKITFQIANPGPVSVVARQTGESFTPFPTRTGQTIEMLHSGLRDAQAMFAAEERENAILAWILRGVGWLCLWIGFALIFSPLRALGDVLPFLGDLIGVGTGLFSLVLSLMLSLITISVAWLVYHPLIAGGGLLLALLLLLGTHRLGRSKTGTARSRS